VGVKAGLTGAVSFGHVITSMIIAEGIEVEEERTILAALGVAWGQGYHLGRPSRLGDHDA
jgi:EAL domain-containing protein (putative c-di-GMP-specific phosphodiesterase class I)